MAPSQRQLFSKVALVKTPNALFFLHDRFGERFSQRVAVRDEKAEGPGKATVATRTTEVGSCDSGKNGMARGTINRLEPPRRRGVMATRRGPVAVHDRLKFNGEVLGPWRRLSTDEELEAREHHPRAGHP
jgi:hypothetical protein